jgi:membrane protease YdiL (CAAX protease family)
MEMQLGSTVPATASPHSGHRDVASQTPPTAISVAFVITFLTAWFVLDRLVAAPPTMTGSLVALVASGAVLLVSERIVARTPWREIVPRLGIGRPTRRALIAATLVGAAVVATFVAGATVLGIELELRPNWPAVLVGALLFHGLAEELVWRGYVYGRLRAGTSFRRAVRRSMPLIALTHVPIIVGNGLGVGALAVLSAIVTCLPFAYLYDRGGRTIWAPAIVHGLVGTWQLFERTYPLQFSLFVIVGSIITPLAAFAFGDRFFRTTQTPKGQP